MLDCMNVMAALGELSARELRRVGYDNPLRLLGARIEPRRLATAPPLHLSTASKLVGWALPTRIGLSTASKGRSRPRLDLPYHFHDPAGRMPALR